MPEGPIQVSELVNVELRGLEDLENPSLPLVVAITRSFRSKRCSSITKVVFRIVFRIRGFVVSELVSDHESERDAMVIMG